jgi:hypothetical protein
MWNCLEYDVPNKDPLQVFNMQRLAVLTTALGQTPPDPELIFEAMKDRVHQPYRKALVRRVFHSVRNSHLDLFSPDTWPSSRHILNYACFTSRLAWHMPLWCRSNHPCACNSQF